MRKDKRQPLVFEFLRSSERSKEQRGTARRPDRSESWGDVACLAMSLKPAMAASMAARAHRARAALIQGHISTRRTGCAEMGNRATALRV
jgi:hypothetical protein